MASSRTSTGTSATGASVNSAGTEPLQARLMKLAQTLQFAWFCGHVTLLLCTLRFGLSYLTFNFSSRWAKLSYRTACLAAAVTYGIVVYKGYRARQKSGRAPVPPVQMLADENVQYLIMAIIWLISRQTALAILPFAVFSVFHIATYTRGILLPALQPQTSTTAAQKSGLGEQIGRFIKDYYDIAMTLVAGLELALWFRILGSALLFRRGSWVLLLIYTVFLRARISQSAFVQSMLRQLGAKGDELCQRQDVPPAARSGWQSFKGVMKQVHDQTDLNRYLGGASAAPKKAN
ncbi:hypothetical protein K470DRAFT_269666 [Piedraia hortae CBS 480.64]|uniref:Endoplasmic reticulum protein n=1 Tax=Piedraia hortae CBS 480.64 TaxID=1314780 RepID=A0A6A7C4D4_9PEZI|nr:hypothetical protein K470DRAFT_269666 [Piedraia hortae CBS 480.64]